MKTKINWEEEKDKIENLLKEGKTLKELADIYNVRPVTMAVGIKNHISNKFSPRGSNYTKEEIKIIKDYLDDGKSIEEITSALGGIRTSSAVKNFIIRYRKKYNFSYTIKRYKFSEEDKKDIERLFSEGYNSSETARRLGFNVGSVANMITRLKLDNSQNKGSFFKGSINKKLTKSYLEQLFIRDRMTIRGIAKLVGVSVDTIRRRLNKYSITRPKITKEKPISKQTKHRVEVLTNYLKREPTKEELNIPYWDIFKKEDVEKVYISCNYNIQKSSKVFDIGEDTFRKILKHFNIPIHCNPKLSDYSDEFYKECIKSGMSYSDISEKTNLSSSTIGTYIGKNFPELRLSKEYSSFGENMVGVVLKSFGIQFRYNKQIYIEKNREVYIDFSFEFNNQEYWIEYNGKQHYEFIKYFHQIEDNFKKQQERDQEVRNYAAKNNITLIELPYNKFTTTDSISSYLLDKIPGTIINEPVDIFHLDPEILNNFKNSNKFKSNLFYIFDSNDGEILTTSEAAQKYKTIRTNVKSWSLKGKRGLKVLYRPTFNYKSKKK